MNGDFMLFQNPQNAHVRDTARKPAAQRQTNTYRSLRRLRFVNRLTKECPSRGGQSSKRLPQAVRQF